MILSKFPLLIIQAHAFQCIDAVLAELVLSRYFAMSGERVRQLERIRLSVLQ
jgi:hypothetical protein